MKAETKTPQAVIKAAWSLANDMNNIITPAIAARDQLIRDLIRDHDRNSWLGTDYYTQQATALGVLPKGPG